MEKIFEAEPEREYQDRTKKIEGLHSQEKDYLPPRRPADRMITDNKQGSPDGRRK